MYNDFFFTINQAAIILNRSDKSVRVYITEGALHSEKRYEDGSGIEKVFVSASSLADLARVRGIIPNYEALARYAPEVQREAVLAAFQHDRPAMSSPPSNPLPTATREAGELRGIETTVEALLREQIARLETQNEDLGEKLERKDARIEALHQELLDTTKRSGDDYRLLALAKEQLETRFAKVREHVRTISLATNRDIARLKAGKLSAQDLSPLPLPSEINPGEFEPPNQEEPVKAEQEEVGTPQQSPLTDALPPSAEVVVVPESKPKASRSESARAGSRRLRRVTPEEPAIGRSRAKPKREGDTARRKTKGGKKRVREKSSRTNAKTEAIVTPTPTSPAKKRGFLSRLFGRAS